MEIPSRSATSAGIFTCWGAAGHRRASAGLEALLALRVWAAVCLCSALNGQRCSISTSQKGQSKVRSALFSRIKPETQVVVVVVLISKLMPRCQEEAGGNDIGTLQPAVRSCLSSRSLANRPSLQPASPAVGLWGGLEENPDSLTVKRGQQCWW